jgi:hypothetical protein
MAKLGDAVQSIRSTGNKRGSNKGITARARELRREEAEARNAKTLPENRRKARP